MLDAEWTINGVVKNRCYWLADGIYPDWPIFLKTIQEPKNEKEKYFAQRQESVRKDVERAFGVLFARWYILSNPCRLWDVDTMALIVRTCVILHNMIIEYEWDDDMVVDPKTSNSYGGNHHDQSNAEVTAIDFTNLNNDPPPGTIAHFLKMRRELKDVDAYYSLRNEIVNHLWNQKGNK